MAKKKGEAYSGDANERDFDEEPDFDDPEGYVDDITDEELLADLLEKKPCETDGVENVVIIDNIPKIPPARLEKLNSIVRKLFSGCGTIVNVEYPTDEEGNTKGYAFLEYKDSSSAEKAVKILNNHRLDKAHTFSVNLFCDVWTQVDDSWEKPQPQPYKLQNDLYTFLVEPDAYDQFCVVAETMPNSVQVQLWQNAQPEPNELLNRDKFTENFIKWSPLGTYTVTFHKPGVVLWGGPAVSKVMKFPHAGTQIVDFSPCEKYLVTYGPSPTGQKIIIWDIRSGAEKRSFTSDGSSEISMFRWSKDDRYVASMGDGVIHVYETPSFYLLDMKSIKVPGIKSFSWSPTDNIIAYWVAEETDVPAKVVLMDIPRKNEVRTKNLFNVADCNIHWQKSGDYLCVKVDRYQKCKKDKKDTDVKYFGMFYNFEIFHMREKDIPVDSVEIKESIHAFSWEPVGHKFAIIHGEANSASVSFFETKKEPTLVKKLEKKVCTHLFWSPRGQFIVLANLQVGSFEFVDTNDFTTMNSGDHYRASDVEWDPTGRYVMTGVSSYKVKEDHGYYLWSFQGRILKRVMLKNFIQFAWRPRPPTLLSEQQQKEIKKNLKKYYSQFESKDRMRLTRASKEILEKRAKLREQFMEYRNKRIIEWESQKTRRMELRNNVNTDTIDADSKNVEEEIVEFLVKEDTTLLE